MQNKKKIFECADKCEEYAVDSIVFSCNKCIKKKELKLNKKQSSVITKHLKMIAIKIK